MNAPPIGRSTGGGGDINPLGGGIGGDGGGGGYGNDSDGTIDDISMGSVSSSSTSPASHIDATPMDNILYELYQLLNGRITNYQTLIPAGILFPMCLTVMLVLYAPMIPFRYRAIILMLTIISIVAFIMHAQGVDVVSMMQKGKTDALEAAVNMLNTSRDGVVYIHVDNIEGGDKRPVADANGAREDQMGVH